MSGTNSLQAASEQEEKKNLPMTLWAELFCHLLSLLLRLPSSVVHFLFLSVLFGEKKLHVLPFLFISVRFKATDVESMLAFVAYFTRN